jgi:ribose 5-phosphate isomerase A
MKGHTMEGVAAQRAKAAAARAAAGLVADGMSVGLGSGSTVAYFIEILGERCRQGLKISCVASSEATFTSGQRVALPMVDMVGVTDLDITIDGADEIDPVKNMIKGGGGALLREKILASISREMVVIVDSSKLVKQLGTFPLPIEVVCFGLDATLARFRRLKLTAVLRRAENDTPYITDNGNYIIDIQLNSRHRKLRELDTELRRIPGVVETGLFLGLAGRVVIGYEDGTIKIWD